MSALGVEMIVCDCRIQILASSWFDFLILSCTQSHTEEDWVERALGADWSKCCLQDLSLPQKGAGMLGVALQELKTRFSVRLVLHFANPFHRFNFFLLFSCGVASSKCLLPCCQLYFPSFALFCTFFSANHQFFRLFQLVLTPINNGYTLGNF